MLTDRPENLFTASLVNALPTLLTHQALLLALGCRPPLPGPLPHASPPPHSSPALGQALGREAACAARWPIGDTAVFT